MSSLTNHTSFIQHQDTVCVKDRADTLRDDQRGGILGFFFQRSSQDYIGLVIKSGKTVVENINLRILGNGSGNGQTLFLTSGNIGASLGDRIFQSVFFFLDKFPGLGDLGCSFYLFRRSVVISITDIRINSP